jgi:transposase
MPKTYKISEEQTEEIKNARAATKDKQTDKRLRAVQLRGEGKSNKEIATQLETSSDMVSRWVSGYAKHGLRVLMPQKRTGRPLAVSYAEEEELLKTFKGQAEAGQMIEVSAIKAAYELKIGHSIGGSQIYYVLKRHGWRKLMPRSKHPKRASDEEITASKKLTIEYKN